MRLSDFFGLNLSQTEELAACYLFLNGREIRAFSQEIINCASPLADKLKNINPHWAREIAAGFLQEAGESTA